MLTNKIVRYIVRAMGREFSNPSTSEIATQSAIDRAANFTYRFLGQDKQRVVDQKTGLLFQDLHNARIWGVLGMLNGEDPHDMSEEAHKKRLESQKWADETFTPLEQDEIVQLCIETGIFQTKRSYRVAGYLKTT